jgi:hypothetical protein
MFPRGKKQPVAQAEVARAKAADCAIAREREIVRIDVK